MKIFITGLQRSGTTLLRDIISKHPDVKHMFHEQGILRYSLQELYSSSELLDFFPTAEKGKDGPLTQSMVEIDFRLQEDNWGEKIPYYQLDINKNEFKTSIIEYCSRWKRYFENESRIVHIVRHPFDVATSNKNSGYTPNFLIPFRTWASNVPQVLDSLNSGNMDVFTVKYEDILCDPARFLDQIFSYCSLDSSPELVQELIKGGEIYKFDKIEKERAFNYKSKPNFNTKMLVDSSPDIAETISRINQFGSIEYSL